MTDNWKWWWGHGLSQEFVYKLRALAVARYARAVNRVYSVENGEKKEETIFVDVTLWGRQAEVAGKYLKKGRAVFIEGHLRLDTWDDRQTGQKRSKLRVVGENVQFLSPRPEPEAAAPVQALRAVPQPAFDDERNIPF